MKEQFIPIEEIGTPDRPVMIKGTGVVIGKFYPPHKGHKLLIDTAQENCKAVTVIVCDKEGQAITGDLRKKWLEEIHPNVVVRKIHDVYPENDSPLWAKLTIGWLHYIPEFAFTSEDYGATWTENMGNTHILVDKARVQIPISGTKVRENPEVAKDYLEPVVWEYFAKNTCPLTPKRSDGERGEVTA